MWGTIIGVGATLLGANQQSKSASNAVDVQAASTDRAIAAERERQNEQARQYDLTRSDYAPYREAGIRALGQYQYEVDTPMGAVDATSEPGYQFGLTQGQTALDRKAAAAGGRVSGAALKAASQFGNDYATTKYDAAYQRMNQTRSDRLNRLASLAGLGQTATGGTAAATPNTSGNITALISAQGNAAGAAQIGQSNIWGNAINNVGAAWQKQAGGSGVNATSFLPSGYSSAGDDNRALLRASSGYGGSV